VQSLSFKDRNATVERNRIGHSITVLNFVLEQVDGGPISCHDAL